ncbi:GNAT family N-acetyltransferase [Hymenobacter sp. BT491]|uniref:GNAT family N-acetyltransferase n=1 Tax=Hymenobacter sp. BT491 TaxID=2766779 RepID=UPI0016539B3B|nr:GNAT family N-acetyltransferase [Hymenobacter sp. BT491]MBC6990784.1 GNAT family N-acetyltransferase [Hymenobacter sp. BT491]
MPSVVSPPPVPSLSPIRTSRLTIRPYSALDEAVFFALLDRNRGRLHRAFPSRVAAVKAVTDAQRVLRIFAHDWQAGRLYAFGIWNAATAQYVGDISLKPNWARPVTAEIGYYLDADAEGNGYAREALEAAVHFGFTSTISAERLTIRCYADNPRSFAVALHAGFKQLAVRPRLWPLRSDAKPEILHFSLHKTTYQQAH